jgi:hypothetical protein
MAAREHPPVTMMHRCEPCHQAGLGGTRRDKVALMK